jgi:hypothetical protein
MKSENCVDSSRLAQLAYDMRLRTCERSGALWKEEGAPKVRLHFQTKQLLAGYSPSSSAPTAFALAF